MSASEGGDDHGDDAIGSDADLANRSGTMDPRMRSAWRTWLSALAVDAEAAVAASLAYQSLPSEGRDAWIEALGDVAGLGVPPIALYAPLLAIEEDEGRRVRLTRALATLGGPLWSRVPLLALLGEARSGERLCAIVSPLYLDFVDVLVCRYRPDVGFVSVHRDPVRNAIDAIGWRLSADSARLVDPLSSGCAERSARPGFVVDGVAVTPVPLRDAVEGLAHAIIADHREGRAVPKVLEAYAHLFAPEVADLSLEEDMDRTRELYRTDAAISHLPSGAVSISKT